MTDLLQLPQNPFMPYDRNVAMYNTSMGQPTPFEFGGWQREEPSWKRTAYLHAGLNPSDPVRLSGPDALRLLQEACTNDFTVARIGGAKHAIICADTGRVIADGVIMRTGEESFDCFFLNPVLRYLVDTRDYDVELEDLSESLFLFQLGGPRSLDILQAATGADLRGLRFMRHQAVTIDTADGVIDVRAFRFGVAGTLAYEVHGPLAHAPAVYDALLAAGEPFGIERLGLRAYGMNHTQNGFAQAFIHFLPAWTDDPALMDYLGGDYDAFLEQLPGSAGKDLEKRYGTPYDFGWGDLVVFNHEFAGRAALEALTPTRAPVTLVWEPQDVLEVLASQFSDDPHDFLDLPADPIWTANSSIVHADDVLVGDGIVGISSGRIFSASARQMLSFAVLDKAHTAVGDAVEVLWGTPGSHQRRIRATVAAFPYLDMRRNPDFDTARTSLPGH